MGKRNRRGPNPFAQRKREKREVNKTFFLRLCLFHVFFILFILGR